MRHQDNSSHSNAARKDELASLVSLDADLPKSARDIADEFLERHPDPNGTKRGGKKTHNNKIADFEGVSLPPFTELIEREVKFFVPLKQLNKVLDFSELNRQEVFQHYFPESYFPKVKKILGELGFNGPELKEITRARIRHIQMDGLDGYFLQVKGPKSTWRKMRMERIEISFQITQEMYERLLPEASAGSISKLRFVVKGKVEAKKGVQTPVKGQIDYILAAGKRRKDGTPPPVKIKPLLGVLVDFELPQRALALALERGRHDFEFLGDGAINVSRQSKDIQDALSTSHLAKSGYDKRAAKAAERLMQMIKDES